MIEQVELIIRQPGHPERVVRLQEGVTRLGRAEDNDIVLSDVGVSRRHSRLVVNRDHVRVEDLGSGNGTYYRGFRIQSQQVEDGDELVIDPFVLQFRIRGQARKQPGEPTMPASGAAARLDVISGAGLAKTTYPIGPRGLTIGRSETRDVVIADPAASRHHCSILVRENSWVLRDMGSANGVFVNGVRVRESLLSDGDRVRIGNTELRFVIGDATQADSTTQRVNPDPWIESDNAWTEHDLSLPVPESPTPEARHRRPASNAGRIVLGGLGLAAAALLMLVGVAVVVIAVVVVLQQRPPAGATTVAAVSAPTWSLEAAPATSSDVRTLQEEGMEALRSGDNKGALERFWRVLHLEPGKASAERLAFAAGEYLVLESLAKEMQTAAETKKARDERRTKLLADVERGGSRRRAALDALVAEFREDPTVNAKLGWTPSAKMEQFDKDLADAAEKATAEQWAAAGELYAKVLAGAEDPTWQKTAKAGLKASRRELSRTTSPDWRAGVAAERAGDAAKARAHYQKVLEVDPGNPSARIRLARLGS